MTEVNNATETGNTASSQRERVLQQITGVQNRLEKKGVGAAFYRAAKPDPVGDMGVMGSLLFHAILSGPLEELIGEHLAIAGHGELDSALTLGGMEAISLLSETQERPAVSRLKSAFYPLGRNNKKSIAADRKASKVVSRNGRFSADVQAELAFLFELTDMLNHLEEKDAVEINGKRAHFVTRKSVSPAYQGVERRRRPRPEGMFSA